MRRTTLIAKKRTRKLDAFFRKVSSTTLVAASDHDAELLKHIKTGQPTRLTFKRIRNYQFHKKFFALLDFAFDHWTPPDNYVGEKNFDQFRADVIILCGFYHQWIRLDGSTRTMPKSISFGSMTEDEFEKLFTKAIDVIIRHVQMEYQYDAEQLRSVIEQVEAFE